MASNVISLLVAHDVLRHGKGIHIGIPRIPLLIKEPLVTASVNDLLVGKALCAFAQEGITPVKAENVDYVKVNHCFILRYLKYCFN